MLIKKPIGVGLVIGLLALAFTALPAMAQASPTLRSGKTVLGVGAAVTASSSNLQTVTSLGTLSCTSVALSGTVKVKEPAKIGGTGTASGCSATGGVPVEITSITFEDEFLATLTDTGTVEFKFNVPLAGLSGCHLGGTIGSTWTNESGVVPLTKSTLTGGGGSAGCPTSGELTGTLTLGSGVVVHT